MVRGGQTSTGDTTRDEVTDYLERYAAELDVEIQTDSRVETIRQDARRFLVHTEDGRRLPASGIVVGAGDSAAQIANELAPVATVTIATGHPVRFIPQRIGGHDVHYWFRETGFDTLPAVWLRKITGGSVVTDSVGLEQTSDLDRRPEIGWKREPGDVVTHQL